MRFLILRLRACEHVAGAGNHSSWSQCTQIACVIEDSVRSRERMINLDLISSQELFCKLFFDEEVNSHLSHCECNSLGRDGVRMQSDNSEHRVLCTTASCTH